MGWDISHACSNVKEMVVSADGTFHFCKKNSQVTKFIILLLVIQIDLLIKNIWYTILFVLKMAIAILKIQNQCIHHYLACKLKYIFNGLRKNCELTSISIVKLVFNNHRSAVLTPPLAKFESYRSYFEKYKR